VDGNRAAPLSPFGFGSRARYQGGVIGTSFLMFFRSASPSAFLPTARAGSLPPIRASVPPRREREHMKTFSDFLQRTEQRRLIRTGGLHAREPKAAGERASAPKSFRLQVHHFIRSFLFKVARGAAFSGRVFRVWSARCTLATSPPRRCGPRRPRPVSFWRVGCASRPEARAIS
jgi:hypothetical protein